MPQENRKQVEDIFGDMCKNKNRHHEEFVGLDEILENIKIAGGGNEC